MVSNSPCGVERRVYFTAKTKEELFLIHRVELKDIQLFVRLKSDLIVSNSPCGVERDLENLDNATNNLVSNSPCGVESPFQRYLGLYPF